MAIPVRLEDQGRQATITRIGQTVVAPYAYDDVKVQTLNVDDTAENFWTPCPGYQVVVSGMIVSGDRNLTASGALVEIFEAATITSGTSTKDILNLDVAKNSSLNLLGLNLLISEGVYVNAKADDSNVLISIMGYYVPKLS